jgi:hypothetical protein
VDIATVSVIVAGAVGLGGLSVPIITERMADRRRSREARGTRFDELREVVDAATKALIAVHEAEPRPEEVEGGPEAVSAALPRLRAALFSVRQQEARLAARLGPEADLVMRYREAQDALRALHTYWLQVTSGDTPRQSFDEANDAISLAVAAFFSVAAETIGPARAD